jgi:heterodisulfide reductase subunit A2
MKKKERIGVYICHCGGNISDYVDVKQIKNLVKNEQGVIVAKDIMFACADSSQKEMVNDIKEQNLDAIVVASCSPKLHLHTFRNVAKRAGINQYNYVQVNIREQCSWPHSDHPKEATQKAAGLVRAGIRKVAESEALETIEIEALKSVIVIGAGVAGMRSAIDMARMGISVFIIEQDYFVGGRTAQNDVLFTSDQKGKDVVRNLYNELQSYKNITLFTGAQLEKVSGNVGNFKAEISIRPRCIAPDTDRQIIQKATAACSLEVPNEFDYGLTSRKAIYKSYAEALPDTPAVDIELLKKEAKWNEIASLGINLEMKPETISLRAGAILVTTGFDSYIPKEGEFAYGTTKQVITLAEFKRIIEMNDSELRYQNRKIGSVAFVYCVGGRQKDGERAYCSRYCCTSAIHTSVTLHKKYKDVTAYHLYRDIRTYGKQELLYEQSSRLGDIYLQYKETEPPLVEAGSKAVHVKVNDQLSAGKTFEFDADLVVLVTGMQPRENSISIAEKLKIPLGNDKFFNEIHPKLKPVETVINGVYIGGSCQGPKNIKESVMSSLSASAKINGLIKNQVLKLEPIIARVDADKCTWCGKCAEVCDYDAVHITELKDKSIAAINEATCKGCGLCAPVCPTDAIEIARYSNREIQAMIDGFLEVNEFQEIIEEASPEVKTETGLKEYPQLWKEIVASIGDQPKTIPQLAEELQTDGKQLTYHLMTMNKYNIVMANGIDDNDEYYLYTLKK